MLVGVLEGVRGNEVERSIIIYGITVVIAVLHGMGKVMNP